MLNKDCQSPSRRPEEVRKARKRKREGKKHPLPHYSKKKYVLAAKVAEPLFLFTQREAARKGITLSKHLANLLAENRRRIHARRKLIAAS